MRTKFQDSKRTAESKARAIALRQSRAIKYREAPRLPTLAELRTKY